MGFRVSGFTARRRKGSNNRDWGSGCRVWSSPAKQRDEGLPSLIKQSYCSRCWDSSYGFWGFSVWVLSFEFRFRFRFRSQLPGLSQLSLRHTRCRGFSGFGLRFQFRLPGRSQLSRRRICRGGCAIAPLPVPACNRPGVEGVRVSGFYGSMVLGFDDRVVL